MREDKSRAQGIESAKKRLGSALVKRFPKQAGLLDQLLVNYGENSVSLKALFTILDKLTSQRRFTHMKAILPTEVDYPLADMFVELSVSSPRERAYSLRINPTMSISDELEEEHVRRTASRLSLDKATSIKNHHSFVVLGDPGSGKTSLLKSLAQDIALGKNDRWVLPIFISLREYWLDRKLGRMGAETSLLRYACREWLIDSQSIDFTRASDKEVSMTLYERLLKDISGDIKNVVFLLDGYDEVSSQEGAALAIEVEMRGLSRSFSWMLTSRQTGFYGGLDQNIQYEIVALNEDGIRSLVENWFSFQNPDADTDFRIADLMSQISNSSNLEKMGRNPFLLSLLCSLRANSEEKLPLQRSQVYRKIIDLILTQARNNEKDESLFPQPYLTAVSRFCNFLYTDAEHAPRQIFEKRMWDQFFESGYRPKLSELVKSSRLLTSWPGLLEYHFVHLTFHEYFVAEHLFRNDFDSHKLRMLINTPGWRIVLRFYVGMLYVNGYKNEYVSALTILLQDVDDLGVIYSEAAWWLIEANICDSTPLLGIDIRDNLWIEYEKGSHQISEMIGDTISVLSPDWAISQIEERLISTVGATTKDSQPHLISLLGKINRPRADELLLKCFSSENIARRRRSVEMIAYKNTMELRSRFLELIGQTVVKYDAELVFNISVLAVKTKSCQFLPMLIKALQDSSKIPKIRMPKLYEGIAAIDSEDVANPLLEHAQHQELPIRSMELLIALLKQPSDQIEKWLEQVSTSCSQTQRNIQLIKFSAGLDSESETDVLFAELKGVADLSVMDAIAERAESGHSMPLASIQYLYLVAASTCDLADQALSHLETIEGVFIRRSKNTEIKTSAYRALLIKDAENIRSSFRAICLLQILAGRRDAETFPIVCEFALDKTQSKHLRATAITTLTSYKNAFPARCMDVLRKLVEEPDLNSDLMVSALTELGKISAYELRYLPASAQLTEARAIISAEKGIKYRGDTIIGLDDNCSIGGKYTPDMVLDIDDIAEFNDYVREICKELLEKGLAKNTGKNTPLFRKDNNIDGSIDAKTGRKFLGVGNVDGGEDIGKVTLLLLIKWLVKNKTVVSWSNQYHRADLDPEKNAALMIYCAYKQVMKLRIC